MFENFFKKLKNMASDSGVDLVTYGILRPCYRCKYAKSREPVLVISEKRGPRVIVNYNKKTYARRGDCIGYKECGKCFEQIDNKDSNLPCVWRKI